MHKKTSGEECSCVLNVLFFKMQFPVMMPMTEGNKYSKHCILNLNLVNNFVSNVYLWTVKQEYVLKLICCNTRKTKRWDSVITRSMLIAVAKSHCHLKCKHRRTILFLQGRIVLFLLWYLGFVCLFVCSLGVFFLRNSLVGQHIACF